MLLRASLFLRVDAALVPEVPRGGLNIQSVVAVRELAFFISL
jgi:hypothetical protein